MRYLLLILALVACGPSQTMTQAETAEAAVKALSLSLPAAVVAYQLDCEGAVHGAATAEDAVQAVEAVRARWRPAWEALEALTAACGDLDPTAYVEAVDAHVDGLVAAR